MQTVKELAKGAFARVYQATMVPPRGILDDDKEGVRGDGADGTDGSGSAASVSIAIKVYGVGSMSDRAIRLEKAALITLAKVPPHPNVAGLVGQPWSTDTSVCIPLELCGKDLMEVLDSRRKPDGMCLGLPSAVAANLLVQAAAGLDHCLSRRVVHMDVKPENLCLTEDGCVKLVDFGSSLVAMDRDSTWCGVPGSTAMYRAPESAAGPSEFRVAAYDAAAADVWSLGMTVLVSACGWPPWTGTMGDADPGAPDRALACWMAKWAGYCTGECGKAMAATMTRAKQGCESVTSAIADDAVLKMVLEEMCAYLLDKLRMKAGCKDVARPLLQVLVLMLCPLPALRPTAQQVANDPWLLAYRAPNALLRVDVLCGVKV